MSAQLSHHLPGKHSRSTALAANPGTFTADPGIHAPQSAFEDRRGIVALLNDGDQDAPVAGRSLARAEQVLDRLWHIEELDDITLLLRGAS